MVVHCKKNKFDVYIGRGSPWGNPFKIGLDGTREQVIGKYRTRLALQMKTKIKNELRGKVLGCWCAPLPCHGNVLAEIANERLLPT